MGCLEGKVLLVTGGGSGIGAATARAFAREGAAVGLVYHSSKAEAEALASELIAAGGRAVVVRADCGDDGAVRGAVAAVAAALGGIDVLVCSAGTTQFIPLDDLDAVTDEAWDSILRLNLRGPFYAARAAAPFMRARGGGLVVNVGSVAGDTGGGSSLPYAASKGGLATMTKTLARALAPSIRVNAVAPGIVKTRWVAGKDDFVRRYGEGTPMGRVAEAEDVANVILSFATLSTFLTGEIVAIDGGREMR